jgi:hypothetical protein
MVYNISVNNFYNQLFKDINKYNDEFNINTFINKHRINDVDYNTTYNCIKYCINNYTNLYNNTKKDRNKYQQSKFRDLVSIRFNNKCIITNNFADECQACHIIPLSELNNTDNIDNAYDVDNGLFMSANLHNTFDKGYWTINPHTYKIEIIECYENSSINNYEGKIIDINNYPKLIEYLNKRYNILKK